MKSPLEPFFAQNGFVILDGGLATELEAQGASLDDDLWSAGLLIDNPALIRDTHLAYYRAGADVAVTSSYQASFDGFSKKGINRSGAEELLLLSIELAVSARDQFWREHQAQQQREQHRPPPEWRSSPLNMSKAKSGSATPAETPSSVGDSGSSRSKRLRPLVAASVGCYGAALADGSEYLGDYGARVGEDGLRAWHRERLGILAGAQGVDFLLFETIPCLTEVRAILSLLQEQEVARGKPAVLSVSCRDGDQLRSGEGVRDFASLLVSYREKQAHRICTVSGGGDKDNPSFVVGAGVNCTVPAHVAGAVMTLSEVLAQQDRTKVAVKPASALDPGSHATSEAAEGTTASFGGGRTNEVTSGDHEPVVPMGLVAYPNSGEEWDAEARHWVRDTGLREARGGAREFARMAKDEWWSAGARVIGGCCRTRPYHVTEIRQALTSMSRTPLQITGNHA